MNRKQIIRFLCLAAVGFSLTLGPIGSDPAWAAGRANRRIAPPGHIVNIGPKSPAKERIRLAGRPLSTREKKRLQEKWRSMTPQQRQTYRHKMQKFNSLPDKDKQLIRRRHDQLRQMSPSDRRRLQQNLNQWDKLSPKERQGIRRRFLNQPPPPPQPTRRRTAPSKGGGGS